MLYRQRHPVSPSESDVMASNHHRPISGAGRPAELAVANLFYAATQLLLVLVLARLENPTEVGRFAFALAMAGPIHIAIGLRLRSVRVIDRSVTPLSTYIYTSVAAGVLALGITTTISFAVLSDWRSLAVVVTVSASKLIEGVVDVFYGELQRHGRVRALAVTQTMRAVAGFAGFAVGVKYVGGALGGAIGLGAAWAILLLYQFMQYRQWARVMWSDIWTLARGAWPLGAASGLNSLNENSSRLVAEGLIGTAATGIVAIVSYPGAVVSILSNSLGQALLGRMRDAHYHQDRPAMIRAGAHLVLPPTALGGAMIIAAISNGEVVLRLAFGVEYTHYSVALVVMLISATVASLSTALYYGLLARGVVGRQGGVALFTSALGIPLLLIVATLGRDVTYLAFGALGMSIIQLLGYGLAWVLPEPSQSRHDRFT